MNVCLAPHDFSVAYNRLDLLLKLKRNFPDFRVSLFMIPYQKREDYGPTLLKGEFLKEIKRNLDWMQIIPHGYAHQGSEMQAMSYKRMKNEIIPFIEKSFEEMDLPYEKGFCSPHWRWNEDVVRALDELGWFGAITPVKKMPRTKRFYEYNYSIDEPFWESDKKVLKLHAHIYGTKNDLGKCFNNLMKLPKDTKWSFVTEHLEND